MENLTHRVRIGMMDERITLQRVSGSQNGAYGEVVQTWSDLATLWARVEYPTTGTKEDYSEATVKEYRPVNFTIRYRSDISAKDRVQYQSEVYDIENIEHIGRKAFTIIKTVLRK